MGLFQKASKSVSCAAVIVAAGTAKRMEGVDKILADLGGQPVIVHTIRAFDEAKEISEIVVVAREDQLETIRGLGKEYGFPKLRAVVPGGQTRTESVQNGLQAVSREMELVAIQDGARPLVTEEVIRAAVEKAAVCQAAAPGILVKDTVKVVDRDGRVISTPPRETLRAVQTPQVFQKDLLLAAWKKAAQDRKTYTDDCGAMEALGVPVLLTQGSEENIKITTRLDLALAEQILKGRETYESWTRV